MGDRANIVMKFGEKERVFFYTHWDGADIVLKARNALEKKWRWDDAPYLARIVFDELCAERGNETGYGISTGMCDNSYHLVEIDPGEQVVNIVPEKAVTDGTWKPIHSMSFEKFAALTDKAAYELMAR